MIREEARRIGKATSPKETQRHQRVKNCRFHSRATQNKFDPAHVQELVSNMMATDDKTKHLEKQITMPAFGHEQTQTTADRSEFQRHLNGHQA